MGYKCKKCGTNNGITYYVGKVCKVCEEPIVFTAVRETRGKDND